MPLWITADCVFHCLSPWPAALLPIHHSFPLGHIQGCMTPVSDVLADTTCIQMTAEGKKKQKTCPFCIYTHTHTHTHTHSIFSDACLGCARRQFYVVGDLRLWSRCLGSDNIMTESTGVTATGREHTHTQTDTRADTYSIACHIGWRGSLFAVRKSGNVICGIILTFGYNVHTAAN